MAENKNIVVSKDVNLSKINAAQYNKPKKETQETIRYESGKMKILNVKEYPNGVKKSKVVGIMKGGKTIYDRGFDKGKV